MQMQSKSSDNCMHLYNVEILNLFEPELQLKDTKSAIKNKLKELLSKFKKFKVQSVLSQVIRKEMIVKSSIPVLG